MRNLKPYFLVSLFSCLGFIVGFAVCHAYFAPSTAKQAQSAPSSVTDSQSIPTPVQVANINPRQRTTIYLVATNQAASRIEEAQDDRDKEAVTLIAPTFPPRVIGVIHPLEEFAKELRNTNR